MSYKKNDTLILAAGFEDRSLGVLKEEVEKHIKKNNTESLYKTMFVSTGVFEVTVVPELSSVALHGQPVRLIAFPSFNIHQLLSLHLEIQPAYYTLINGIPPSKDYAWRPEAIKKLNKNDSILRYEERYEEEDTSTLYYNETLDLLLDIYDKYAVTKRIFIAPTGSKMQTVAVGIFRTFMNDVQIVYPVTRKFAPPKKFTSGVKKIYRLKLEQFDTLLGKNVKTLELK